jgi:hypothetical protein
MLYGILFFYSIDLQQYHRHSTLAAGLAFLPMTVLISRPASRTRPSRPARRSS